MLIRLTVLLLLACSSVAIAEPRQIERLPKVEQIESGETPIERLTDRQLIALMLDLTRRADFDRSQNNNRPGPDGDYLQKWITKVAEELRTRGYAAGDDELIDVTK